MPEGDTVWHTASRLHAALAERTLTRTDFRVPRLATADLAGRRVLDVTPRGKHLLTRVEGGLTLHSHLGMDGSWRLAPSGRAPRGPAHHIRAVLVTAEQTATGYRLPLLEILRTAEEPTALGHLGPDLLGPDWDAEEAERRLLSAPDRPLAEALLDQRNLAGIGNVYAAELCFLAGTSPWAPVGSLREGLLPRLLATARRLLDANKDTYDRRTTKAALRAPGNAPYDSDRALWVYGRARRPCHRCGTPVGTGTYGPPERARTVWYCPRCQPGPAQEANEGSAHTN
ncbi:DNA-formamidopyrimidine glycosylase family protein [Streptomyces sp. ODS28]|uniref:Fpg/Nei family DNA glycosylase n=1 Tax=Streptomyces sp. ODS28 TaxID=3136688 RepID=UPI0031EE7424